MKYNLSKIEDAVRQIELSVSELDSMLKTASTDLSEVDQEINDIYHYIEFASLDACRGFKAYQMLKERLIRRREVKNCQEILLCIKSSGYSKTNATKILKKINERKTPKYKPRVLNELFGKEK